VITPGSRYCLFIYITNFCIIDLKSRGKVLGDGFFCRTGLKGRNGVSGDPSAMHLKETSGPGQWLKRERGNTHLNAFLCFFVASHVYALYECPPAPWPFAVDMTFNMLEDDLAASPSNDTPDSKDEVHIRCDHFTRL
jgi:hypothetical protein